MKSGNALQRDESFQQLLEAMRTQNELYKQVLAGLGPIANESKENRRGVLKFTRKEILQIPTNYRNVFATNDIIVHYRLRKDGVYEARFHRNGIDIEVSSKDLTKLKQIFIEKLNNKDFSRGASAIRMRRRLYSTPPTDYPSAACYYLSVR